MRRGRRKWRKVEEGEKEDVAGDKLKEMEMGLQMVKQCTKEEEDDEKGKHVAKGSEEETHGWCDLQRGESQQAVHAAPTCLNSINN